MKSLCKLKLGEEGTYILEFETVDKKAFEKVQEFCRMIIDGNDEETTTDKVEWGADFPEDKRPLQKLYLVWEEENGKIS